MKKIVSLMMLVCLLCSFAACGAQEETAAVIITPEPVSEQGEQAEQSQVVVPDVAPMDQAAQGDADGADETGDQASRPGSGSNTTTTTTNTGSTTTTQTGNSNTGADPFTVAQGYVGSSLSALQGAIGSPNSSEYVLSCLEDGLQEGLLYYDGFMVWTIQYTDGSEIVKGVS